MLSERSSELTNFTVSVPSLSLYPISLSYRSARFTMSRKDAASLSLSSFRVWPRIFDDVGLIHIRGGTPGSVFPHH